MSRRHLGDVRVLAPDGRRRPGDVCPFAPDGSWWLGIQRQSLRTFIKLAPYGNVGLGVTGAPMGWAVLGGFSRYSPCRFLNKPITTTALTKLPQVFAHALRLVPPIRQAQLSACETRHAHHVDTGTPYLTQPHGSVLGSQCLASRPPCSPCPGLCPGWGV